MLLSVAVMVKEAVPVVVGVLLSTPVLAFRTNPDGRLPALIAKEYVPEPPVALRVAV
jgi:hypothetical protein